MERVPSEGGEFEMGQEPLVSVVIPTYNRSRLCEEAVASALAQTWRPIEVIVVDDGSSDDTRERFESADEPVRYVWQENSERAAARNRGVDAAGGELIAFLDSDDVWDVDHLARAVGALREHSGAALAFGRARYVDDQGRILWAAPAPDLPDGLNLPGPTVKALAVGGIGFPLSSVVLRRQIAVDLPFNEDRSLSRSEDWELWLRIAARYPVVSTGDTTVSLRMHPGNTSQDAESVALAMERAYDSVMADSVAGAAMKPWAAQTKAAMDLEIARLCYYAGDRSEARTRLDQAMALAGDRLPRSEVRRLKWLLAMPLQLATSIRSLRRILARRRA